MWSGRRKGGEKGEGNGNGKGGKFQVKKWGLMRTRRRRRRKGEEN